MGQPAADIVVVGAGPAGMAAAASAARRGANVVLVDGSARLGGQYFRQPLTDGDDGPVPPAGPRLPPRFHSLLTAPGVQLRLGSEVWSAWKDTSGFALSLENSDLPVCSTALVLATGASELTLPFPGWDLPGVLTAGAAQALLKSQRVPVGQRVVVAGSGPFLLPVAAALAEAGARVIVIEAAPASTGPRAFPSLVLHPGKLIEAATYACVLARHRARFLTRRAVVRCEGAGRVERVVTARLGPGWVPVAGSERVVVADAVCVSFGFVPRLELARQLGASDLPRRDHPSASVAAGPAMGSSVAGLFVAGELAGVAGADVAELEGEVAGHAAATYVGLRDDRAEGERRRLADRLNSARAFAERLLALYPLGVGWTSWLEPPSVFCRCELTTWGAVEAAITQGAASAREVRNLTRCGMGYCQGRTCGPPLQLALSALTGLSLDQVGDLHNRPVAVPVTLDRVANWRATPSG